MPPRTRPLDRLQADGLQRPLAVIDPQTPPPAPPPPLSLGGLDIERSALIPAASAIATDLAEVIKKQGLSVTISNRPYVKVEGWSVPAAMLNCSVREVEIREDVDDEFTAVCDVVRNSDGVTIGRGSAICGPDEKTWANRDRYARRSMASTRAAGKACRIAFAWIMGLAGFETTPMEEMPPESVAPAKRRTTKKVDSELALTAIIDKWKTMNPEGDRDGFVGWAQDLLGTSMDLGKPASWDKAMITKAGKALDAQETPAEGLGAIPY